LTDSDTFCENRVVPVYYYFLKYRIAHLIKTLPGKCILPFINQPVENLLCVQNRFLNQLLKFTNTCRKNRVNLDDMPHQFFVEFSLGLTVCGFNKDKGWRIYKKHRGWE